MVCLLRKENVRSRHQCLFEENIRKTKMEKVKGLRILKMRIQKLFTHREGINSPHARHKGWQPLIKCANHDFKIMYFPFWFFYVFSLFMFFIPFIYFFSFFGVDKSVSLAPTYPRVRWDLCSSLSLKFCVLHWFYLFWKIDLSCEQKSFKTLDLWNDLLIFEK